jgi:DNA-binding beta-propeller fold protein YncE
MKAKMQRILGAVILAVAAVGAVSYAGSRLSSRRMGPQPDGSFIVSSGQRVEPNAIAFDGRPTDIALHPSGAFCAVLGQSRVFLLNREGVIAGSAAALAAGAGAGYHGLLWSPDGKRLYASDSEGTVDTFDLAGTTLTAGPRISIKPEGAAGNPRPGGMAITRDGSRLYVAACDRSAVAEIDLRANRWLREFAVQNLPFTVRLTADEKTLVVSNWGGRQPAPDDEQSASGNAMIVTDPRGVAASGTVGLIDCASGHLRVVPVGNHPTDIVVDGNTAYIANAAGDSVSQLDIAAAKVTRTLPLRWGKLNLFGSMPCALALHGRTLYLCNGGDNAVCEMDLNRGTVRGFRPAGYFPIGIALTPDGKTAYVVNTKGNGSVRRTVKRLPGNAHDFQGTVSVLDLNADLAQATARVVADNGWNRDRSELHPHLAVYNGAIKHVLYIIKENRTYDEVLGDLKDAKGEPLGDGDPKLCDLGETTTPNAHALARQFTLFDNGYVSGTNSADGHAWSTQAMADDYLEHFYTGYRTYPDDGDCAMSLAAGGCLWDTAAKAGKTIRNYGEYADDELAVFTPQPKDWLEVWKDRISGQHRIEKRVGTRVASLRPYLHPHFVYWPLLQSDQERADLFEEEYKKLSREDKVPNLMIMALPCDHTEGRDPKYPKPQCMVADNDLALGRIVDVVSHSPQWKDTCIFVIEDDAQSGPDHVDGHRTVYMALSPYIRRGTIDHSFYNTVSMIRSIELMLGIEPMNRFDALTPPLAACFMEKPDLTPYTTVPASLPLDQMNTPLAALKGEERVWTQRSLALDWSGPDRADPQTLNAILWHTLHTDSIASRK